jgi:hypothetical protein
MTIEDIITWCKENNEVAWLKSFTSTKVAIKRYPKVKGADGKVTVDKTAEPTISMEKPTFIQIKKAFAAKFMPEIMPSKSEDKKPSMYEIIDNL